MADTVTFNQIPANLRVPLFYAEINAGQSPFQGPSRTLLIGQKTSAGSAPANAPIRLDGDPTSLFGAGSMLTDMAVYARQSHPFGEIWCLPLADPSGATQIKTVTVGSGILGSSGDVVLYIAGERVEIGVAPTDANTDVAVSIVAAVNAGYMKFNKPMSHPVIAAVDGTTASKVNFTARHVGALGAFINIDTDIVGDEGPLQTYLTVGSGTAGTGTPTLATGLAALGDQEYDWIGAPYADTTTLDGIKDFLGGTSGRWSPLQQLYGHYVTALFNTMSNLATAGAARNDPNVSIMGVSADSPSPPWRWVGALVATIAADKNLGSEVDQAYRISQPLQTLVLDGIQPPKNRTNWFTATQRNQLYQDGIAGFRVAIDGTVSIDRVVTTYQTNSFGSPDITWLDVETRAQMVYFVRYMRQRITQTYPRAALASDGAEGRPGIVTPRMLKAECIHAYVEMEDGGLVEKSDLFANMIVVERSTDPNRVNAYLPVDVVNQFRVFAANATTFLEYPA